MCEYERLELSKYSMQFLCISLKFSLLNIYILKMQEPANDSKLISFKTTLYHLPNSN